MTVKTRSGENLSECPYCGSDEYYVITYYRGRGAYHFRFDGEMADNSQMYDCLSARMCTTAFCGNCQKRLGTTVREQP